MGMLVEHFAGEGIPSGDFLDEFDYEPFQGSIIHCVVAHVVVIVTEQFWIVPLWACHYRP